MVKLDLDNHGKENHKEADPSELNDLNLKIEFDRWQYKLSRMLDSDVFIAEVFFFFMNPMGPCYETVLIHVLCELA